MKVWAAGTNGLTNANLNSTFGFDAIVTTAVAVATGAIYPTVAAALTAGHKHILVQSGSYSAGFTCTTAGARIVAAQQPVGISTPPSAGAIFGDSITISADDVLLSGLAIDAAAIANGFILIGHRPVLLDCVATRLTSIGILAAGYCDVLLERCRVIDTGGLGISLAGTGTAEYHAIIRDCFVSYCTGYALQASDADTADRLVEVDGGYYCYNDGGGIHIPARTGFNVRGAQIQYNTGDGIRVETGSGQRPCCVVGCYISTNSAYGVNYINATEASATLVGNYILTNGTANINNGSLVPGLSTNRYT